MAIQARRGNEIDFIPDRLEPGEWAVSLDRKYIYMCFGNGDVRRMSTYEEMVQNIQDATKDVAALFTAEVQAAILEAMQSAADADLAAQEADAAAARANTAADQANGVSDDLISKRDSGYFNGPSGPAATIQVGTVTASAPGGNPQVTNSGTTSAAVFDFVIPRGAEGPAGGKEIFQSAMADFPATGQADALYVDTSADPAMIYYWTGSEYKQAGGAGSGGGGSAAVVTFLRSGWTAGDSGYTQTIAVPGMTDTAEPQLQLPKNATAAQSAVWDSIKKSVPAAGNLTLTVDSQPVTDMDVIVLNLPEQEGVAVGDLTQVSQRISQNATDIAALAGDVTQINTNLNELNDTVSHFMYVGSIGPSTGTMQLKARSLYVAFGLHSFHSSCTGLYLISCGEGTQAVKTILAAEHIKSLTISSNYLLTMTPDSYSNLLHVYLVASV